jgi:type IV pilus assembly protein PilC
VRQSLLRLIAVAAEESLPLTPLVEAWASDERGAQRKRLQSLAELLKNGTPLPDAVEAVPGILSDEDVLAIRFGAQSGALSATIRDALADPAPVESPSRLRKTLVYCSNVLFVGAFIVAFIHIRIVPVFEKILVDYKQQPPVIFQWSRAVGTAFVHYWYVVALALAALLLFTYSARPGRLLRRTFLGRFLYPVREFRAADVLEKLSVATAAGRPIAGALSTLARYHFDPAIRNKLLYVRNEVEQGAEVWQSMAKAGLITPPEVCVLETAERVGNQPWALTQLAAGKERRTMRRLDRLSELILPLLIVAMGVFVLFQALAIFVPLVQLIEHQL